MSTETSNLLSPTRHDSSSLTTSATAASATITLTAPGSGVCNVVGEILWSYSADPASGAISITDGGTTVFQVDVTTGGPGFLPFTPYLKGSANGALVITLASGGSGVAGKVNVVAWTENTYVS